MNGSAIEGSAMKKKQLSKTAIAQHRAFLLQVGATEAQADSAVAFIHGVQGGEQFFWNREAIAFLPADHVIAIVEEEQRMITLRPGMHVGVDFKEVRTKDIAHYRRAAAFMGARARHGEVQATDALQALRDHIGFLESYPLDDVAGAIGKR